MNPKKAVAPTGHVWSVYTPYVERFTVRAQAVMDPDTPGPKTAPAVALAPVSSLLEAAAARPAFVLHQGVALIKIRGFMDKQAFFSDETSTIDVVNALKMATRDRAVGAIMLVLDTPGGSVDGISELEDALVEARAAKPLIAQVDGMAASAGYWAASQAESIFAGRLDQVGSIGVRMALWDDSKYYEDQGMKLVVIDTGEHKSAGIYGAPITKEQIAEFQKTVDIYFESFKNAIVRGRGMAMKVLKPLADGRVFIGQEAVDNGLIDGIQTFEETFNQVRQLAAEAKGTPRRDRAALRLRLSRAGAGSQSSSSADPRV